MMMTPPPPQTQTQTQNRVNLSGGMISKKTMKPYLDAWIKASTVVYGNHVQRMLVDARQLFGVMATDHRAGQVTPWKAGVAY